MSNMISAFPQFNSRDSIFQKMVSMGAPWNSEIGLSMDISYFTMYSGLKVPSFFTFRYIQNDIPDSQLISKILWDMYGKNWQRLWDGYVAEYNPIENYNLDETVSRNQTDDRTIGRKGSLSSTVDGTNNQTVETTGSETLEHGHVIDTSDVRFRTDEVTTTSVLEHGQSIANQNTVSQYRYGFNSTEQVPSDVQSETGTQTHSGTDTTTDNGKTTVSDNDTIKQTNSGTDTTDTKESSTLSITTKDIRSDSTTDDTTDNDELNENITRKRSGNIGVTTTQQMLTQEFELWKWNFYWQVFDDCDKFLCLSVMDECQI